MLELRKYGSFVALVALASCSSGSGAGVAPPSSGQSPQADTRPIAATQHRARRERALAGQGPALTIASFTPPSQINSPRNGLTFAYGGIYYTFSSPSRPRGGIASFDGRYWNDYQSYNAYTLNPLTLDSAGNIYSVIENLDLSDLGIVRLDPHTGVESREFFSGTQYGVYDLDSNIALDSKNQLWFENAIPSAEVIGFAANPATPQQTYDALVVTDGASNIGYEYATNFTKGADGNVWGSGTNCGGQFPCTITQDIFRWTAAAPYTQTAYVIPAAAGAMALGPDGNIWFVMHDASEIGRITTSGSVTVFKVTGLYGAAFYPSAIAAGADGAVWFLSDKHALVGRITTRGAISVYKGFFGELAITRGTSASVPVWFSIGGTPGSLDRVSVP